MSQSTLQTQYMLDQLSELQNTVCTYGMIMMVILFYLLLMSTIYCLSTGTLISGSKQGFDNKGNNVIADYHFHKQLGVVHYYVEVPLSAWSATLLFSCSCLCRTFSTSQLKVDS